MKKSNTKRAARKAARQQAKPLGSDRDCTGQRVRGSGGKGRPWPRWRRLG